jgi:hypothetical protein
MKRTGDQDISEEEIYMDNMGDTDEMVFINLHGKVQKAPAFNSQAPPTAKKEVPIALTMNNSTKRKSPF